MVDGLELPGVLSQLLLLLFYDCVPMVYLLAQCFQTAVLMLELGVDLLDLSFELLMMFLGFSEGIVEVFDLGR